MEDEFSRLLTLVPWSLQRLLGHEYEVRCDSNGASQSLELDPDHGKLSTERMMEALKASPLWDPLDKLSAWRDHLTPERISEALAAVFLPPHFLAREELLHAEWPEIVASVYWGHRRLEEQQ